MCKLVNSLHISCALVLLYSLNSALASSLCIAMSCALVLYSSLISKCSRELQLPGSQGVFALFNEEGLWPSLHYAAPGRRQPSESRDGRPPALRGWSEIRERELGGR